MTTQIKGNDTSTFGGAITANNVGAGNVLQVVQGSNGTQGSTTSTSYVTTNLSATITPSSTSSKILIITSSIVEAVGSGYEPRATIYRNGTSLESNIESTIRSGYSYTDIPMYMQYLDSPSSTSAITYTVYMKTTGGTTYWHINGTNAQITLLEIAG